MVQKPTLILWAYIAIIIRLRIIVIGFQMMSKKNDTRAHSAVAGSSSKRLLVRADEAKKSYKFKAASFIRFVAREISEQF